MLDSTLVNLQFLHTFHLDVGCHALLEVHSTEQVIEYFKSSSKADATLILGSGSNVLFTESFAGTVLLNRIKGIEIQEQTEQFLLHVGGGEDWPSFVETMVNKGIGGFENLAMIPGCVGSSPIQNIGAYGVELNSLCDYVDYIDLETLTPHRLKASECQFGYRDSVFKQELKDKVFITAVGFKVAKSWQAKLEYGALANMIEGEATPAKVFKAVCDVRSSKLPNPAEVGNAGSFFKNPVVGIDKHQKLLEEYPAVVGYPVEGGVKLAAGWLIDQAGLKGTQVGGAQVHPKQALVLTNKNNASPQDIITLADKVRTTVRSKFGVELEHEVRFMDAQGETNLDKVLGDKVVGTL